MTTLHPFSTSWESVLPVWSSTAQSRRSQPDAQVSPFVRSTLNLYLSVMLTLATITKHAEALSVLERSIPWYDLTQSFATIPRGAEQAMDLDCAICPLLVKCY
ncbi:hypothetical protein M405DRAFT_496498 [Rhizopogon salebrosus TDB-379]|nr:hypothetical protein M405DRAFT_496498 [Rhizopogon salebrosus TDB-379]